MLWLYDLLRDVGCVAMSTHILYIYQIRLPSFTNFFPMFSKQQSRISSSSMFGVVGRLTWTCTIEPQEPRICPAHAFGCRNVRKPFGLATFATCNNLQLHFDKIQPGKPMHPSWAACLELIASEPDTFAQNWLHWCSLPLLWAYPGQDTAQLFSSAFLNTSRVVKSRQESSRVVQFQSSMVHMDLLSVLILEPAPCVTWHGTYRQRFQATLQWSSLQWYVWPGRSPDGVCEEAKAC